MTTCLFRRAVCALAIALPASAPLAQTATLTDGGAPERPGLFDLLTFETLATGLMHSALSAARVFADIRYQHISVDPVAARLTLLDLDVRPLLDPSNPDGCLITAERATLAGQPLDRPFRSRMQVAMDAVSVSLGCLPREGQAFLYGIGLQRLHMPRLDMMLRYDPATGGGTADISADLAQVAALDLHLDADYISFRMDMETEEPLFAVDLNAATLTIDDRGAWELGSRMMPAEMTQPDALGQIATGGLAEVLNDANGFDSQGLSAAQRGLVAQAGVAARAVAEGAQRLVLSTNIANPPFRLNEETTRDFKPFFDALAPSLTLHAPRLEQVFDVAEIQAALNSETLPANALDLGRALLSGIGAPRNRNSGLDLLARASFDGSAEAAYLVAEALAEDEPETAYVHALRAAAANMPGALAILDLAERGSTYAAITVAQKNALTTGPDPALYDSVIGMRQAARAYMTGIGRSRSYEAAYYWASMAAAAGDAAGAAMRDQIDETMRLRGDAGAWAEEAASLENGVLRDWINENVPARLK